MESRLGLRILDTLKKYGSTVSVDFLAEAVGRRRSEIESYLQGLELDGVITRSDDKITLTDQLSNIPRKAP